MALRKKHSKIQFYWSRKDETEITSILKTLTKRDSIIWDPFMGSGSVLSGLNSDRLKFVGTEINEMPYSTTIFNITKKRSTEVKAFEDLLKKLERQYGKLYEYQIGDEVIKIEKIVFRNTNFDQIKEVRFSSKNRPSAVFKKKQIPKKLSDKIIKRYKEYSKTVKKIKPEILEENSRIAIKKGMRISDIFSPINFYILKNLKKHSAKNDILRHLLASILHLSRLTDLKSQSQFPYWIPKTDLLDRNIFTLLNKQTENYKEYQETLIPQKLARNFKDLKKDKKSFLINMPVQETDTVIPNKSIDLVITDPPYYDQVPYSEYLKIWEYFLGFKVDLKKEIVVSNNKNRNKNEENYLKDFGEAFELIHRKLKDDGKMVMYFKSSNVNKMEKIKNILKNVGFDYTGTIHLPKRKYTYKQNTTQKTSLTGNNLLSFQKTKKTQPQTKKVRSIIENEQEFLKQIVTGYLYSKGQSKIIEIMNLISSHKNTYFKNPLFKNSKTVTQWLDSFTTYDPKKRTYSVKVKKLPKNNLFLGDAIEVLKSFPTGGIDCCITDPPYNIDGSRKKEVGWYKSNPLWKMEKGFNKISEKWDNFTSSSYQEFTYNWLKEVKRTVKKNGNIVVFGSYHNIFKIGHVLEQLDLRIVNTIVWYKRNAFPNITQRMLCESTEYIIWAVNESPRKAKNWTFNYEKMKSLNGGKQMRNMWDVPNTPTRERRHGKHPSQKPLEVLNRLILGLTNKKDLVLDPFLGSGTTAVAAISNGRNYIGIDNNPEYLITANNRIESSKQN